MRETHGFASQPRGRFAFIGAIFPMLKRPAAPGNGPNESKRYCVLFVKNKLRKGGAAFREGSITRLAAVFARKPCRSRSQKPSHSPPEKAALGTHRAVDHGLGWC